MSQFILLAPIVMLFALGLFIALRSGPAGVKSGGGIRVVAENFWATLVHVALYTAGLFMLEHVLGTPPLMTLNW